MASAATAAGASGAAISTDDPVLGDRSAPVTIVEYGDFKCPSCTAFATQVQPELVRRYVNAGKVRLVWRDFPVIDGESEPAAQAASCAAAQGRFWQYHDALYSYVWSQWYGAGRSAEGRSAYAGHYEQLAAQAGLDSAAFGSCVSSGGDRARITHDRDAGRAAGVAGTPTFFVDGRRIVGAQPIEVFAAVIDEELAKK